MFRHAEECASHRGRRRERPIMRDQAQSCAQPAGVQYPGRRYLGICGASRKSDVPRTLNGNGAGHPRSVTTVPTCSLAMSSNRLPADRLGRSRWSMFGGNHRTTLSRSRATRDVRVASETDDAGCRQSGGIALRVSPRFHPELEKWSGRLDSNQRSHEGFCGWTLGILSLHYDLRLFL